MNKKECNIILAHGSKREETRMTLDSIIEKTKRKLGSEAVFGAYLQLCDPLLDAVLHKEYEEGYRSFKIMPLFLFDGVHVLKDIPQYIEDIKKQLPDIEIEMLGHIGDDDRIADIVIDRIKGGK